MKLEIKISIDPENASIEIDGRKIDIQDNGDGCSMTELSADDGANTAAGIVVTNIFDRVHSIRHWMQYSEVDCGPWERLLNGDAEDLEDELF